MRGQHGTTQITETRGREALAFIRRTIAERGYPPSRREITDAVGLSSSSDGQRIIDHLVDEGLIEVDRHGPRGIRVVGTADIEAL